MFQVSNFEISPHISDFRRFFSYFLDYDDSEPREHWLCWENFAFGRKKIQSLTPEICLRSRKLEFGRESFKVWHLKHRRLMSVENMFLARAFMGRCNRRYSIFRCHYYFVLLVRWRTIILHHAQTLALCFMSSSVACCQNLNVISHVWYINILMALWLSGQKGKFFKFLLSQFPKETWYKENTTKYRSLP